MNIEYFNILLKEKNRKKVLITIGLLILLNLIVLTTFYSNAYYHEEASFKLINSKVSNNYDYVLKILIEDSNYRDKYIVTDEIPSTGYIYDKFICNNNGTISYDSNSNNINGTFNSKDICMVYFRRLS